MRESPLGAANTSAMLHDAFGMHGHDNNDDNVEDQDVPHPDLTPVAENFYRLIKNGQKELYPGCGRSKLDFILELYQLKAENSWSDVSCTGPRLQRLYMSRHIAESMVWHSEQRNKDEVLRHYADPPSWKHLDNMYPSFASEPRNVRLGLASDGFNPFGMMSLSHSTWPVVMSVYNFPPSYV
ncbi:hypothetical protein ACLB2K_049531 [Fragaria x ananassa]